MNERIKKLAEQAGGEFYTGFFGSPNSIKFKESDLEKFAEFLVKECSNFLKDTLDDDFAAEQLEEHFGVEE